MLCCTPGPYFSTAFDDTVREKSHKSTYASSGTQQTTTHVCFGGWRCHVSVTGDSYTVRSIAKQILVINISGDIVSESKQVKVISFHYLGLIWLSNRTYTAELLHITTSRP